jgi:hypothetical protein
VAFVGIGRDAEVPERLAPQAGQCLHDRRGSITGA